MKSKMFAAASALAVAIGGGTGVAVAQEQQGAQDQGGVGEIIVTAQRREESAQSVPIAVSAFSPAQLETLAVGNTLELTKFIPNLVSMNNTGLGSANVYFLRGLGNTESIATFDPPVGTYIDDVYITRQNANNFSFFDLNRVEVLRGPQGTLFGRNTTGGAINMIMNKPAEEMGGYLEATYGAFEGSSVRGSVDLPVNDHVRTKFSGYAGTREGYARNTTTGEKVNGDDNYGFRIGVEANLTDSLVWDVALARVFSDNINLLNTRCSAANPAQCGDHRYVATGLTQGSPNTATGTFISAGGAVLVTGNKASFGLGNEVLSDLFTSNLQWDLGGATLNFITGYFDLSQEFALDFFDGRTGAPGFTFAGAIPVPTFTAAQIRPPVAGGPNGSFTITNEGDHRQFTQEIKLNGSLGDGSLDYVAGLFYLDENNKTDFADIFFTTLLADRLLNNRTRAYAAYIQGDYHLTDTLTVTGGVRYTDEEKEVGFSDNRAVCAPNPAGAGCLSTINLTNATFTSGARIPRKLNTDIATPRVAVNWKPAEDLLFFASATRGFKSGGWNARGTAVNELLPFDPEKVWSYEAGIKSQWFDNRLRANATVFHADTEDLQTISAFLRANGTIAFITRNFADLKNEGAEIELTARPWDALTLFANVGLQDANYEVNRSAPAFDRFGVLSTSAQQAECRAALAGAVSPGLAGATFAALTAAVRAQRTCGNGIVTPQGNISDPVRSPDTTVSAGISYEFNLGGLGRVTPAVSATYSSDMEVGTSNVSIYAGPGGTFNLTGGQFITGSHSDAATYFNATLKWEDQDGRFNVTLECTNCGDETSAQSTLSNFTYLANPMMWELRVKANF